MDSTALIPVHWGWFWFQLFLFLTFFIHILLMNVMLGTGFIALVSHFRRDVSSPCTKAVFTATCLGATADCLLAQTATALPALPWRWRMKCIAPILYGIFAMNRWGTMETWENSQGTITPASEQR